MNDDIDDSLLPYYCRWYSTQLILKRQVEVTDVLQAVAD